MLGTLFDFFIQWHLTERCNLRCRHCYQQENISEMSYEEVCQGIANIKKAIESWVTEYGMEMTPSFHFTGGEPFLRRDLFDILDYTRSRGFSTSLMSNGNLITGDLAHRIAEAQVKDVQVSLDGLETVHDSIRGKGSFQRALNGIRHLISQGIDTNINLTVSRLNMGELEGLVRLAEELGISAVTFSRLVPCGSGEELMNEMLTPEELANLYGRLNKIKTGTKVYLGSRDPLALVADINGGDIPETEFPIGGCAAGVFGVTVTADGSIMPCRRMNLRIGNIKEGSFRELWAESPVLWALRQRQNYNGGCGSCRYWAMCRGCRAIALAFARAKDKEDYLGLDPQCPYYQPVKTLV